MRRLSKDQRGAVDSDAAAQQEQLAREAKDQEMRDTPSDDDPMPFGKWKGRKLGGMPASYLLWLWDGDDGLWCHDSPGHHHPSQVERYRLHLYIKHNFSALEQDAPDKIIKHRPPTL